MMPSGLPPACRRAASSRSGRSPSPSTTRSKGPSWNIASGLNVASIPPATKRARGAKRRARWANARSCGSVIPVVENPTMSHASRFMMSSSAASGVASQAFGSNTRASTPRAVSTPMSRQTPRGGARNVYSPPIGSYGPTSRTRGWVSRAAPGAAGGSDAGHDRSSSSIPGRLPAPRIEGRLPHL